MHLIETAPQIALATHAGQTDKAGRPYILHPLRLMAAMHTDEERAVALLHDVIEDGDWNRARLIEAGIPAEVADAVQTLSRRDGEGYPAFIERVLGNPLATRVKRVDIEDNLQVLRLPVLSDADLARVAKYHRAWHRLSDALAD